MNGSVFVEHDTRPVFKKVLRYRYHSSSGHYLGESIPCVINLNQIQMVEPVVVESLQHEKLVQVTFKNLEIVCQGTIEDFLRGDG